MEMVGLVGFTCPWCGEVWKLAKTSTDVRGPSPGHVGVCYACLGEVILGHGLEPHRVDDEVRAKLSESARTALVSTRGAILIEKAVAWAVKGGHRHFT